MSNDNDDKDKSARGITRLQDLEQFTPDDVNAALLRNDPAELALVSLTVAMVFPDPVFAQEVCLRLSSSSDPRIRGHAIASLGHLARRFRALDEKTVKPVVEKALLDVDEYVRMNARSAADELHQFLFWNIAGHIYG